MDSTLTAYIACICVSGVFNFFLSLYAYSRREHMQGATIFILYTLALTIYCFAYAIGLTSSSMEQVNLWTTVQYIGMPASAPLGLIMVMRFLGKKWTSAKVSLLFVLPAITLLLVATNEHHHLYYKSMRPQEELGLPFLDIEIGLWYVVQGIFTFSCLFYAFIMLLLRLRVTKKMYRAQLIVLIFGQLVPMVTAFLYLIGATPAGIDPVPLVMWITSGLYIWAILSANMLSLLPIAKETIFDNMSEGVIVLDGKQRLVDFNAAAKRMFPALQHTMNGYSLNQLWTALTGSVFPISQQHEHIVFDFHLVNNNRVQYFQARTSLLKQGKQKNAGSLIMLIDVTKLKQLQRELEMQAYYDGLTQIYNRAHFYKLVQQQLDVAEQPQLPISFILFDVDYFKQVNDTYGHDAGDQLLIHICNCCNTLMPEEAVFARYGGEEFVIAIADFNLEQAKKLAEQLRAQIEKHPLQIGSITLNATASFGVAELQWNEQQSLQQALVHADQALYKAKRAGRNQVAMAL